MKPFASLERNECRFIHGEPHGEKSKACGKKTRDGCPYCGKHKYLTTEHDPEAYVSLNFEIIQSINKVKMSYGAMLAFIGFDGSLKWGKYR